MADETKKPASQEEDSFDSGTESNAVESLNADAVIDAFGGIRPMASKLGIAVSTVQGWKTRGHIPDNRWRDIIAAAGANDIDLSSALPDARLPESDETFPKDEAIQPLDAEEEVTETSDPTPWEENEPLSRDASTEESDTLTTEAETEGKSSEPSPQEDAAPPSSQKQSGGGLALMIGVLALAAVLTRPAWSPQVDPYIAKLLPIAAPIQATSMSTPSFDTAAIEERLNALEAAATAPAMTDQQLETLLARIETVESAVASLSTAASELSGARDEAVALVAETQTALDVAIARSQDIQARVVERLAVIEAQVAQLSLEIEAAIAKTAALGADLANQEKDLQTLMDRPALQASSQAGLALAASDLESALAAGRSPTIALRRLIGLAGSDGDLVTAAEALNTLTQTPLATRTQLTTTFRQNAAQIHGELGSVEGDAWDTLWSGAQALISIRRKGESADAPPVSRAEAALARDDLNGAIAALSEITDRSETASVWVQEAERLLLAEEALAALRAVVTARLSTIGSGDAS